MIEMQGESFILNMVVQGLPSKVPQEMYRVIGNAPNNCVCLSSNRSLSCSMVFEYSSDIVLHGYCRQVM